MYHDVEGDSGDRGGFEGAGPALYALPQRDFTAHLDAMATSTGAPPVPAHALDGRPLPRSWVLTFDDGGHSAHGVGEQLSARGWPGHFFVCSDLAGTPGFADWDALRALAAGGHVIGSHTASHPPEVSALSDAELASQWSRSVERTSDELGVPVTVGSVPGGYYSERVGRAAAAAGIRILFVSAPTRAVQRVGPCLVVGRYTVRRSTTPQQAAAAAAGDRATWLRQRAGWELRAVAKRVGGSQYRRLRTAVLARR